MGEAKDPADLKCIEENISVFKAYDEKSLYQYWVETTSSVPFSSAKKAEKHKKYNKRLVVVGKYRMFFIKKGGFSSRSSRTLQKIVHFYDILEFSATEKADILEMKYTDKDKGVEPVSMRIKTDTIALLLKTIRTSYRSISIGFHESDTIKFLDFDKSQCPPYDSELEIGPANGFLETYMAKCSYYRTRPSIELSRYICYLVQNGITDLDLSNCPGVEQKTDISFDLPTVFATVAHSTYFRGLIVKDVQVRGVLDALGVALQHNRVLTRVQFVNSQEDHSVATIGNAFKFNPGNMVQILDLSGNNLTQESMPAFCAGLSALTHGITVLDLSRCNLGPKGIQALFNSFESNFGFSLSIRELNLSYNKFDDLGTAAITRWFSLVKGYYSLRKLWLESTNIDLVTLGPILRTINNLSVISLAHNKMEKPDTLQELKTFIECSIALTELDLSACHLTPEATEEILQQLGKNQRIEAASLTLNLADNNLGARGALALARALVDSAYLLSLDISRNKLRGKGVGEVLESLSKNQGILELYIGKNLGGSSDGDDLAKPLVDFATSHPNLKVLHIEAGGGANPLGRGLTPFLQMLGVPGNISISTLDISGNAIGDNGASVLTDSLRSNYSLTKINLDRNNIGLVGWQALNFAFTDNRTIREFTYPVADIEKCNSSLPEKKRDALRDTIWRIMRHVESNAGLPHPPAMPFSITQSSYVTPLDLTPLSHVPAHLKDLPPPSNDLVLEKLHTPPVSPPSSTSSPTYYDGASTRSLRSESITPLSPPPPPVLTPPPSLAPLPPISPRARSPSFSSPLYSGSSFSSASSSAFSSPAMYPAPAPVFSPPPPLSAPPQMYPALDVPPPPPPVSSAPPVLNSPPPVLNAPPPVLNAPPPVLNAPPPAFALSAPLPLNPPSQSKSLPWDNISKRFRSKSYITPSSKSKKASSSSSDEADYESE